MRRHSVRVAASGKANNEEELSTVGCGTGYTRPGHVVKQTKQVTALTQGAMYTSVHERVRSARQSIEEVRPAVTTEQNDELKNYSAALLQQALEVNKDNPHFDKYNFVQMPYAKLQNGSKLLHSLLGID